MRKIVLSKRKLYFRQQRNLKKNEKAEKVWSGNGAFLILKRWI